MAAKRVPLGHKGRGEARRAFSPRRTLRQRYAFGMRRAAQAGDRPGDVDRAGSQARGPGGAFLSFAPQRIAPGRGFWS